MVILHFESTRFSVVDTGFEVFRKGLFLSTRKS